MTTPANPAAMLKDPQTIVAEAVQSISHIATLPEITTKIVELVENPYSTAHDLHKLIINDPALVARILKVVNSAFYGLPGQIGSINRAIVLLGLNAVKNIVIAASLAKLFRGGNISTHFSAKELWTHSIAVGVFSKMLVTRINNTLPDEAFLAGLIHDIGLLVELQAKRDGLVEVVERAAREQVRYVDLEISLLGADHQAFGAGLTARWKFPRSFQYVTGHHHNPMALSPDVRWLTCVVHIADQVCCARGFGYALTCRGESIDPGVLLDLGVTMDDVNQVADAMPAALKEVEALLTI